MLFLDAHGKLRGEVYIYITHHEQYSQTKVSWDRMGILLLGRASCGVLGNMVAGLFANCSLFCLLLVMALSQAVLLVGQVDLY